MPTTIHEYTDVTARAQELGCVAPTNIAILPRNFATATTRAELLHESNVTTVRTLLRKEGIALDTLEPPDERFRQAQENDFTWIGPTLLFTAAQLSQNPLLVSVSLGVIANYLTDFFRGISGRKRVTFDVVVEQTKSKKHVHVHFDGDIDGFKQLPDTVMELIHDERTNVSVSRKDERSTDT